MNVHFVTHPEVTVDPAVPVPDWGLSRLGLARLEAFCGRAELTAVTDVVASGERKARDCAEMFGARWRRPFRVDPRLGENDRSSTGYVPPPRFWEIVDGFFARPHESVLGWERAVDAQARIGTAVRDCIAARTGDGDLCIFSHGGVGTLLLCDLLGEPISQRHGQPLPGGGCYFTFEASTGRLLQGWRDIVP